MAKNTLPTNFKDDILNASMNGKRRYNLIQNSDGTVSLEDASTYDQVGSEYGAGQVNAVNKAVNESADAGKIIDDVDDISAVTKEGYIAGALALKEVNNSLNKVKTYVGSDGKLHFTDASGADSVLPFTNVKWNEATYTASATYREDNNNYKVVYKTNITGKTLFEDLFFQVVAHTSCGDGTEVIISSYSYDPNTGNLTIVGWYSQSSKIKVWYR